METVRVSGKAAGRIAAGHPWVFASDVLDRGKAQPGDAVRVVAQNNRPLGVAHFSSTSQIVLRMLDRGQPALTVEYFRKRIEQAQSYRQRVVRNTDAYRLVFGEADLLPGLVIDRYADTFVVQTLTQGMDRSLEDITAILIELFQPRAIVARNDSAVRAKESLPLQVQVVHGEVTSPIPIRMNGLSWQADLLHGQKTGVFLDQRENYVAAQTHGRGRALDCFTCTGGFALHLASVCAHVEAVDSSASSLETARGNRDANAITNVDFRQADVFQLLAGHISARREFDTIVLDPPAFAKSRSNVEAALQAYREINLKALRLLASGGTLISCSCSHHVQEHLLLETIASAAAEANRTLRVLERRYQALDHPILLTVPETAYLKVLFLQAV